MRAAITEGPKNAAAQVGTPTNFMCMASIPTGDYLSWEYAKIGGPPGGVSIYNTQSGLVNPDEANLFAVEVDTTANTYNLLIKDTQLTLGVDYWCSFLIAGDVAYAGLIAASEYTDLESSLRSFSLSPTREDLLNFYK